MAKRRQPPKPRDPSPHIHALQKGLKEAAHHTPTGLALLYKEFPEFRELHKTAFALIDLADARSGAKWDESRGNHDPISSDGKSTSAGRATYAPRQRLKYWRRRVAGMVEAMKTDLDPNSKHHANPSPRCGKRNCEGRGRRQPVGVKYCGFCREEMKV